jgi:hypothetical protein
MVIVNLRGGLGNQLFQLGAALRLTKGVISNIHLNLEHLGNRSFELNKWIDNTNLPNAISQIEPHMLLKSSTAYVIKDPESGPYSDQGMLDTNIDPSVVDIIIDGYFQSGINLNILRKYVLEGARANLNKLFQVSAGVTTRNCSIHYRVGDYENYDVQQVMGMVNLSYIDRAISILQHTYHNINIYSEPNDLLQSYAEKKGLALHLSLTAEEVFSALLESETLVVSNSSFSLSAAYLSNSVKTLFRPARWSRKYGTDSLTDNIGMDVRYISNTFYKPY